MTLIPANYWQGERTIELAYPWITPEAIHFLDKRLKPEDNVLEHGAGGSTLFFANHGCRVKSFETNLSWIDVVRDAKITGGGSIDISFVEDPDNIPKKISKLPKRFFDFVLIDGKGDRGKVANAAIPLMKKMSFLIFDNYGRISTGRGKRGRYSPLHKQLKLVKEFKDEHWYGTGTAIYQAVQPR